MSPSKKGIQWHLSRYHDLFKHHNNNDWRKSNLQRDQWNRRVAIFNRELQDVIWTTISCPIYSSYSYSDSYSYSYIIFIYHIHIHIHIHNIYIYHIISYHIISYHIIFIFIFIYHIILYHIILYFFYYFILYYIILYYILLYCHIILCCITYTSSHLRFDLFKLLSLRSFCT